MQNPSAPVVETRQGALIGSTEGDTHVWCGIPYAAPPVGPWRWRSPRPPARWDGVRPATAFSASSWQSSESCQELGGGGHAAAAGATVPGGIAGAKRAILDVLRRKGII